MDKKLTYKQRFKKACNTDNVIDFSVDVGLIAFDVLASPILIVVRIARFYIRKFVNYNIPMMEYFNFTFFFKTKTRPS